ncbi:hypothetical protein ACIBBB_27685 [Streptomyces sp. NPDC051217]|uniref:DUF7848 domain-containing protein n=1 Tax=Streptomyces sp. NPDC051217 TaxID=3365644 RepID=UPI0037BB5833
MPDSPNAGPPVGNRGRYRFREYHVTIVADSLALPTYQAVCVTGEDSNCGATSGALLAPDELTHWIAEHCAQSGHELYEQTHRAVVRAEPGAWQ